MTSDSPWDLITLRTEFQDVKNRISLLLAFNMHLTHERQIPHASKLQSTSTKFSSVTTLKSNMPHEKEFN